jgi:hypothetical protein
MSASILGLADLGAPEPPRPLWWRVLGYIRQLWNSLAAAGIAPSQKGGPGDVVK